MEDMISIIVPVYNVERYIRDCLESIAAQTYGNFECIIVDDGSTDSSGAICDEFCAGDPRFRVLHQANAGLGFARNVALDCARGEFVEFVDSDDTIAPETLQTAHDIIVSGPYDWVEFSYARITQSGDFQDNYEYVYKGPDVVFTSQKQLWDMFWEKDVHVSIGVWNKLFRSSAIGPIRFKHASIGEDLYFNCRFYAASRSGVHIGKIFYFWLNRQGSLSNQDVLMQLYRHFAVVYDALNEPELESGACRVIMLKRLYRLSLTDRAKLLGCDYYKDFIGVARQLRKSTLREYLHTSEIPLRERILCSLGWYFPHVCRAILRRMGNVL